MIPVQRIMFFHMLIVTWEVMLGTHASRQTELTGVWY